MCEISGQVCTSPEPVVVIVLAGQDRLLLLLLLVTWSGAQLSLGYCVTSGSVVSSLPRDLSDLELF